MDATAIAYKAIELLNKQIEEGKDANGKPYEYSDRPFYMPYNKKLADKFGKKSKMYELINRDKKLGMIIKGGYESIRKVNAKSTTGDFLQWSGEMLSSMTVTKSGALSATIGFNSSLANKKAFWLNYSGVGKSRKIWRFFGLNEESLKELAKFAENDFTINNEMEIGTK